METYVGTDRAQARNIDLFGSPKEWCKASEQWTLNQWQALCRVLFNANKNPHEFLLCHASVNARQRFSKAKRAALDWHIDEAWKTVADISESERGIGFYPWNDAKESYWAALDFDVHDGQTPQRARALIASAVTLLQRESPTLAVIACTSGASQGWHLFAFRTLPRPIAEWTAFLRTLAAKIGAAIGTPQKGGDCELHPIETSERPRGIRVPGSLNPKDGSFGLIAFDTLTPRLNEWRGLLGGLWDASNTRQQCFANTTVIVLAKQWIATVCEQYAIAAPRTRRNRLLQMVGFMVNQCGRKLALKAAAEQHRQAQPAAKSPMAEHLADFAVAWKDVTKKEVRKLSQQERRAYLALKTDTDREAFLIMRNWAKTSKPDFYAHRDTLAARLCVSGVFAGKIRSRFCEKDTMRKTTNYVVHKRATRYRWLLPMTTTRKKQTR
jgi:hypothetical protein